MMFISVSPTYDSDNVSDPANDNNNDTQYLSLFLHTVTAQFPKQ